MTKGEDFYQVLSQITIDNVMNENQTQESLKPIGEWLIKNTPPSLFRFLSGKERNIDAFERDEVWGSRPSTFNDPYECLPSFDVRRINDSLTKCFDKNNIQQFIEAIKQGDFVPQLQLASPELKQVLSELVSSPDAEERFLKGVYIGGSHFLDWWSITYKKVIREFYDLLYYQQCQEYITCFTENRDASLMWAHYADSHKGFCLEYNWSERIKSESKGCLIDGIALLAPVKYSNKRFDATSYIYTLFESELKTQTKVDIHPYFHDMLAFLKILLTKSIDWSYEQEWRLFTYVANPESGINHKLQVIQKPTAVYLGARMPSDQADRLEKICITKEIPCYKMLQSYGDDRFVVEAQHYSEYKNMQIHQIINK